MSEILRLTARLFLCLALGAGTALAQAPPADSGAVSWRQGVWFRMGFGYGRLAYHCHAGRTADDPDPTAPCPYDGYASAGLGTLSLGYAVSARATLAIDLTGWRRGGTDDQGGHASLALAFRPVERAELFVALGAGGSTFTRPVNDGPDETGSGWGAFLRIGWDLPASAGLSLTPQLTVTHGRVGDVAYLHLRLPDGSIPATRTDVRWTTVSVGIAIVLHPSRPSTSPLSRRGDGGWGTRPGGPSS